MIFIYGVICLFVGAFVAWIFDGPIISYTENSDDFISGCGVLLGLLGAIMICVSILIKLSQVLP